MRLPISIADEMDAKLDLLVALSFRVRGFTKTQIAQGFFDGDERKADRTINGYLKSQLLVADRLLIRELPSPAAPLYVWPSGKTKLKFHGLVAKARQRWQSVPAKMTKVYFCGSLATKLIGGAAQQGFKRPLQASHDIGLAATYLAVRRDRPELAKFWIGEDVAPRQLGQIPDAIIVNVGGQPTMAVEFCGLYSAKRLQRFHQFCVEREMPYELW